MTNHDQNTYIRSLLNKMKMMSGRPFYTCHWIHFTSRNALFCYFFL